MLFGHTHIPFELTGMPENDRGVKLERPLYVMNPGSLMDGASLGIITVDRSGRVLMSHGSLFE